MGERTIFRRLRLAALVVAGSYRSLTGAPLPPNPRGSLRSQQHRDNTATMARQFTMARQSQWRGNHNGAAIIPQARASPLGCGWGCLAAVACPISVSVRVSLRLGSGLSPSRFGCLSGSVRVSLRLGYASPSFDPPSPAFHPPSPTFDPPSPAFHPPSPTLGHAPLPAAPPLSAGAALRLLGGLAAPQTPRSCAVKKRNEADSPTNLAARRLAPPSWLGLIRPALYLRWLCFRLLSELLRRHLPNEAITGELRCRRPGVSGTSPGTPPTPACAYRCPVLLCYLGGGVFSRYALGADGAASAGGPRPQRVPSGGAPVPTYPPPPCFAGER